jgi:hypothetical protein
MFGGARKTASARRSARGRSRSRKAASTPKSASRRRWLLYVVVACLGGLGWIVGRYGMVTWPLVAFFAAAVFGLRYPGELRRSIDQHKNLARQVKDKHWDGTGKLPLAEILSGILLLMWIVLLALSLSRYPRPALLSSTIGTLCVALGVLIRCIATARSTGVPSVPLEPPSLDRTIKSLPSPGKNRGRRTTLLIGFVVAQAAAGQVMLGGTFGRVILDPELDLLIGSLLLAAAGAELVMVTLHHRLQSVGDRAVTLRAAMKP